MPASMISAATGLRLKVMGSSIAMVATGPMPGSTPISVPSTTPMKQYITFSGWTATWKPIQRLLKISMAPRLLEHRRPDREGQRQALHEHCPGEDHQDDVEDRHFLPVELVAAEGEEIG